MCVGEGRALGGIRGPHGRAELGKRVAAGDGPDEEAARPKRGANQPQGARQVIDRFERAYRHRQVVGVPARLPGILDDGFASGLRGEQRAGVAHIDPVGEPLKPGRPTGIRAADQERVLEPPSGHCDTIEAVAESPLEQEQLGPDPRRAIPSPRTQFHVEQGCHGPACAMPRDGRQEAVRDLLRACARWALDFALPPRCAGCGIIVADVHSFCTECWRQIEFLGDSGCRTCGLPLQATEQRTCGACLARPPRIARSRAAVAYGEIPRSLAIRLKYGRKVAIARTMARYMAPLVGSFENALFVPVPLHRSRLWWRGFNQSALIAGELSRRLNIPVDALAVRRSRRTPPLKGMSPIQRRKTVAGAFRVLDKAAVAGKTIILIDDVLTTGSTAEACARTLKRAGAERIELVSWARVVKPSQLMR